MPDHDNWESHWDHYAAAASQNPAQQMRHALVIKMLRSEKESEAMRALDIGSGQGDFLVKLHGIRPEAELLGFELSLSGVEISRRKLPAAQFFVADLFQPPPALKA